MYSFKFLKSPHFGQSGGQSSTNTDHIWALTFDPLIDILPDFLDMQNYTFSESFWWSNQFEPIFVEIGPTWKFDPLKKGQWPFVNLTSISRTKHRMNFMYLDFLFLMTQGRIWNALQPNWSMLTILAPCCFTPLLWPRAPDWFMCPP